RVLQLQHWRFCNEDLQHLLGDGVILDDDATYFAWGLQKGVGLVLRLSYQKSIRNLTDSGRTQNVPQTTLIAFEV
ncbi:MAG: hypothetical protein ACOYW3_17265, partial [Bacteroidota bacterium]